MHDSSSVDAIDKFSMLSKQLGVSFQEMNKTTFSDITQEMTDLYKRKNKDYGNSFDKSLDEDGLLVAKIRLGDKFNRFSQLIKQEAEVKDESIEDTLIDLANYAVMSLLWIRNRIE